MDQASQLYQKDTVDVNDQATRDAQDLAALGHAQTLTRKFSLWSMLALAFCVLGTWSTMAQDLATGLVNGGPSASFVFGQWINQTGWGDGVVWFLGLVQSAYGLTAFDSVIHMVEEIPAPRRNAPRTMYLAVLIGAFSGFIFMVVCLFSIQSVDGVLNPASGNPFIELVQSTIGQVGGAVMIALFIFNGLGQGSSVLTSASRLTWSFARDGGFPWGVWFSHVDETWMVPGRALWLQCGIICLVGILYLFASTVLQAILSVSTIALTISYAMPIISLVVVGRDKLPPGGEFKLGRLGPVINWVSIIYCAITTVFFFFPTTPNPTVSEMNFAIAVFGVMLVLSIGFWFVQGHRTFMQSGEMAPDIQGILYAENCELSQDGSSSAEPRPDNKIKGQTSELTSD
ncbi:Choline transport protein [Metarhizium anisopliae]